jgi:putative inorganic carbon (hco3(-)) transporter
VLLLIAATALFGGVYYWTAIVLAVASTALAIWVRPVPAGTGGLRILDRALLALLALTALQLLPLPRALVSIVSPARITFVQQTALTSDVPAILPLTLDPNATIHAWLALFIACVTFWTARTLLARGGIRTVVTALAWISVAFVIEASAQSGVGTTLVYGFWRPEDTGARPLGPFINRNHAGTWSLLVLFLVFGCLQWRRSVSSPARGWGWRARIAHALDGRSLILVLSAFLLIVMVAVGASRSTMLALACAAGYVALTAPRQVGFRRSSLWPAAIAIAAALGVVAYADLDRLLSRIDETRHLGLAHRAAIWRDSLDIIRDFPLTGTGAGAFSTAMRLYQTNDRTYYWNEAHNQYVQVAAEGGLMLAVPALVALASLTAAGVRALRRSDDPLHWMRLGASASLVAVAVQSIWETGLTLPASGMLAAVAAAILVHISRHPSNAPAGN